MFLRSFGDLMGETPENARGVAQAIAGAVFAPVVGGRFGAHGLREMFDLFSGVTHGAFSSSFC